MPFDVLVDEQFQERPIIGVDGSLAKEDLGDRSVLVARPGVEGGDQRRLIDHASLQGNEAKEEIAIGGHGHARAPGPHVLPASFDDDQGTSARACVATEGLSHFGPG